MAEPLSAGLMTIFWLDLRIPIAICSGLEMLLLLPLGAVAWSFKSRSLQAMKAATFVLGAGTHVDLFLNL